MGKDYEEALERARAEIRNHPRMKHYYAKIFPELKANKKNLVNINAASEWLKDHVRSYMNGEYNEFHHCVEYDGSVDVDGLIKDFETAMQEECDTVEYEEDSAPLWQSVTVNGEAINPEPNTVDIKPAEGSEDERIRKELIEALKTSKTVGELKFILPEPTREECISYLEKHKEQKHYWKPTETDVALFNKAVTTNKALTPAERAQLDIIRSKFGCCRAVNCSGIVQKEQNLEEEDHITPNKKFFQWIYDRLVFIHGENPDVDYMRSLKDRIEEMTSKQKPAECITDSIKFEEGFKTGRELGFREGVESVKSAEWEWPNLSNCIRNCKKCHGKCFYRKEPYEEQKPADVKAFEEWIDGWYNKHHRDGYITMDEREFKNFCRGIRNMYQQKPMEWGEKDKKMLEVCSQYIGNTIPADYDEEEFTVKDCRNWLKSFPERFHLEPDHHFHRFTPEQFEYLSKAIITLSNEGDNKTASVLNEIRQKLKEI